MVICCVMENCCTISVFPDKTGFRDYVGVIVDSKTKLWKRGQVKLEFKKKPNSNLFEAFVYMRNHSLRYYHNFTFNDGILGGNWYKTSLKVWISSAEAGDAEGRLPEDACERSARTASRLGKLSPHPNCGSAHEAHPVPSGVPLSWLLLPRRQELCRRGELALLRQLHL